MVWILGVLAVVATAAVTAACRRSRTAEVRPSEASADAGTPAAQDAPIPAAALTVPVFGDGARRSPLSVSVETVGGVSTVLIPRGTALPTLRREIFSTATDSQSSIEVHVLVGERTAVADNVSVGRFSIIQIPAASGGVPKLEVTFAVDLRGAFQFSAKDLATGRSQPVVVTSSLPNALSHETVVRMLDDRAPSSPAPTPYAGEGEKRR
jgi:molecular chaperone DnaK (HSP70)